MLLEIQSLAVRLGGAPILRDVNLTLNEGEIYGLLGPNGAGKSTTIAAALGLVRSQAGTVRVLGHDPLTEPRAIRARLGVLPEQNGFYDWMTAATYLRFFAQLYGRALTHEAIAKRLDQVGLQPRPRQIIGTFSRGMRQRLGLARALIGDPALLILDEPTNGLDPRGRREIHDILIDLSANRGVGVLMCKHLLDDVDRLCKRVGIIVKGRTVAEGDIAELMRSNAQVPRFRLRLSSEPPSVDRPPRGISLIACEGDWRIVDIDPAITLDAAWRELLFAGWPITEIRRDGGGLEDLYLTLTERSAG
jgi:ABC-type multidrug transport system ATPase subunit